MEGENTLKDEYMRRVERFRLLLTGMFLEGVDRDFGFLPPFNLAQLFDEEIEVNGFRRIEIEFVSEGCARLLCSEWLVERILEAI
jgi:hypothetical protein